MWHSIKNFWRKKNSKTVNDAILIKSGIGDEEKNWFSKGFEPMTSQIPVGSSSHRAINWEETPSLRFPPGYIYPYLFMFFFDITFIVLQRKCMKSNVIMDFLLIVLRKWRRPYLPWRSPICCDFADFYAPLWVVSLWQQKNERSQGSLI